jgi:hypothetical protein
MILSFQVVESPVGWEDQGRQEHGWFGHGTAPAKANDASGEGMFGPDGLAQRILAVAHGAVGALPQALRARAAAQYDAGNLGRLTEVMTAWSRGTKLGVDEFAERFFGRAADDPGIEQLHCAALDVGLAQSHAELREASDQLADAMKAIGLDRWPRFLADAQDRARDPATVAAVEKSRQRRNDETTQTSSAAGGKGGGNGPGPIASAVRSVFGHVDPDQWAAQGAAAGGVAGALLGGAAGGAGEGAVGAAGGSLALPGGGTIVGGIAGAVDGAAKGALVGGATGAILGGAIGKAAGELIIYMEGNSEGGDSQSAKGSRQAEDTKGLDGTSGLTRPQQGAVSKVDNIISNGAKEHDFEGVVKELAGQNTGYDHVTEMRNNVCGLRDALNSIRGSLANPNLTGDARGKLEAALKRGESTLNRMQDALSGKR